MHGRRGAGPAPAEWHLAGTLRHYPGATFSEYFYGSAEDKVLDPDLDLIQKTVAERPDAILLDSYEPSNAGHPRKATIHTVRSMLRVPAVFLWYDANTRHVLKQIRHMDDVADLHLVMDSAALARDRPNDPRVLATWFAYDPSLFRPNTRRTIDVSFLGSVGGYRSVRSAYLAHLEAQNQPLFLSTKGPNENSLLQARYYEILGNSKISINFAHGIEGSAQLKGRVFEILHSGALLLESANDEIKRYFLPMMDYVPFADPTDLLDKIRYFLAHDDERNRIAENGFRKVREMYGHHAWWDAVLGRLTAIGCLSRSSASARTT